MYNTESITLPEAGFFVNFVPTEIGNKKMKLEENKTKAGEMDFEYIYTRYASNVMHFACRYIFNKEEAENITHDVFVAFYESADRFDTERDPLPYLLAITKNKCITLLRKSVHSRDYTKYTLEQKKNYLNLTALENENIQDMYRSDVKKLLRDTLDKMPPKVRETFILSRVQGYTNAETARRLGITTRGVEERMKKAMLALRRFFRDYL